MDAQLEHEALYDARPDDTAPNKKAQCRICGTEFVPMAWNLVRKWQIVTHKRGIFAGQPVRLGSFLIKWEKNQATVVALCHNCLKQLRRQMDKAGKKVHHYPYRRAFEIVRELLNSNRRDLFDPIPIDLWFRRRGDDEGLFGAGVPAPLK